MESHESILQKVKDGVYELTRKENSKSRIWNTYAQIRKDDGTILDGYVCCCRCSRLYKLNGNQTSNLNRHKCAKLAAQEEAVSNNDDVKNENDLDEDVKECEEFFSNFRRSELQIGEASSHELSLCNSDTNADITVNQNQATPKRSLIHAKQLDNLCDMIKVDLQDVSDEIFFEAKWKILDVLREVHRKKLTNNFK
ncbi:transposable element Hobo transposase [Zeugodacus cucurbitae]|uniref:Transposable element Hobo transposase n=1 Tax=Zeugodacus cucurbitae TaxID=28588 RepID=A0A0A1XLX7_ZEUCU|nr:transposable element Hobo transposase [Zeugodacus cucurbitae]